MCEMNYVRSMIAQFAEEQNRIALMIYDGRQITEISYRTLADEILQAAGHFKKKGLIFYLSAFKNAVNNIYTAAVVIISANHQSDGNN